MVNRPPNAVLLALAAALLVATGGCESADVLRTAEPPNFEASLTLLRDDGTAATSFAVGEGVTLELRVRNQTDSYQTLEFPDAQRYEFVVRDLVGAEVWRWSFGRSFAQVRGRLDFRPRQSIRFSERWTQLRNDGSPTGPGDFEAQGSVVVSAPGSTSAGAPFELR